MNFACDLCNEVCKQKSHLTQHKNNIHNNIRYNCQQCNKTFTRKYTLSQHEKTHMVDRPKTHQCDKCDKLFTSVQYLKQHKINVHEDKNFKCDICCKLFSRKNRLTSHIKTHNRLFKCAWDECYLSFDDKITYDKHICKHTNKGYYECSHCDKSFKKKSLLTRHIRRHTGERPYNCDTCNESFADKSTLKVHIRTHTGEKPYICGWKTCKKTFVTSGKLKKHLNRHNNIRPFECNVCQKTFEDSSGLKRHSRTHTGEKPYNCDWDGCCDSFATLYGLKTHIIVHHTKERPYKCKQCNATYSTSSGLKKHQVVEHWSVEKRRREKLRYWCQSCFMVQVSGIYYDERMCYACLAHSKGWKPRRVMQNYFLDVLKNVFEKNYPHIPHIPSVQDSKFVGGKQCNVRRRQPDQGWVVGPLLNGRMRFINVEVDENSHKDREISCENAKMDNTNEGVNDGKDEVVFLRIGIPYNKNKKELTKRAITLAGRLAYWLQKNVHTPALYVNEHPSKVGVEYMHYSIDGRKHIDAAKEHPNFVVFKEISCDTF